MKRESMECFTCRVEMIPGSRIDSNHTQYAKEFWKPLVLWSSLGSIPFLSFLKNPYKNSVPVITYCCPSCGILKSVAELHELGKIQAKLQE